MQKKKYLKDFILYEKVFQICVYVDPVCFCGFNQTIHSNRCFCSFRGVRKEPVFSANRKRSDGILSCIIRYGKSSVQKIVLHIWPLVLRIGDCFF